MKVLFRLTGYILYLKLFFYFIFFIYFFLFLFAQYKVERVNLQDGCGYDPEDLDSTVSVCFERNGKFAATRNIGGADLDNIKFDSNSSSHIFLFNETLSLVSCLHSSSHLTDANRYRELSQYVIVALFS